MTDRTDVTDLAHLDAPAGTSPPDERPGRPGRDRARSPNAVVLAALVANTVIALIIALTLGPAARRADRPAAAPPEGGGRAETPPAPTGAAPSTIPPSSLAAGGGSPPVPRPPDSAPPGDAPGPGSPTGGGPAPTDPPGAPAPERPAPGRHAAGPSPAESATALPAAPAAPADDLSRCRLAEVERRASIPDGCLEAVLWQLAGRSDEQIQTFVSPFGEVAPRGTGPWPFVVIRSPNGLKVRDANGEAGAQIGSVALHQPVWATCVVDSGYQPPGEAGSRWLAVLWPEGTEPATTAPDPAAAGVRRGWVFAPLTRPVGHNGDLTACEP